MQPSHISIVGTSAVQFHHPVIAKQRGTPFHPVHAAVEAHQSGPMSLKEKSNFPAVRRSLQLRHQMPLGALVIPYWSVSFTIPQSIIICLLRSFFFLLPISLCLSHWLPFSTLIVLLPLPELHGVTSNVDLLGSKEPQRWWIR